MPVDKDISARPVDKDGLLKVVNEELIPRVREIRRVVNALEPRLETIASPGQPFESVTSGTAVIMVDTAFWSSGDTVELPASHQSGSIVIVKDSSGNASVNEIAVIPSGGTIDGQAAITMNTDWAVEWFVSDGSSWYRI